MKTKKPLSPEVAKKIEAQYLYCNKKGVPFFIPSNGVCWGCGKQITKELSLERCSKELITGCPCCNRSYCD